MNRIYLKPHVWGIMGSPMKKLGLKPFIIVVDGFHDCLNPRNGGKILCYDDFVELEQMYISASAEGDQWLFQ